MEERIKLGTNLLTVWFLVVPFGLAPAEESTVESTGTVSGSFFTTNSDTNGDGIKAGLSILAGNDSKFGNFTSQHVTEYFLSGQMRCPNGNAGQVFTLVPGSGAFVNRLAEGDLHYGLFTSATLCFDPLTNTSFFSTTAEFTGGTGIFAGSRGTGKGEGTSTILVSNPVGHAFGFQSGTYTTTTILKTND